MPDWFVTAVRTIPVSRSVAVTVAPDTAAPVWSVTRPDKLADTCALAAREQRHESNRAATQSRRRPDISSPWKDWIRARGPAHHRPRGRGAVRFNRIESLMSNRFSLAG